MIPRLPALGHNNFLLRYSYMYSCGPRAMNPFSVSVSVSNTLRLGVRRSVGHQIYAYKLGSAQRPFATTAPRTMLTTELSDAEVGALRANKERLQNFIHHSSQWGAWKKWGEYVFILR